MNSYSVNQFQENTRWCTAVINLCFIVYLSGKVVNFNSCHANPSTLQSRMVSINLIIHQQWLIVRYSHLVRSLQSSGAGGTSILGGGGPGPDIKFRGKNSGKVLPSSPNKRKNMGNSVTTRRKTLERIIVLGAFGVIPETQRAKFGVFVIHIWSFFFLLSSSIIPNSLSNISGFNSRKDTHKNRSGVHYFLLDFSINHSFDWPSNLKIVSLFGHRMASRVQVLEIYYACWANMLEIGVVTPPTMCSQGWKVHPYLNIFSGTIARNTPESFE